ncbi:MAG: sensor histidine kinase, partial [Spirochaetaceae bacterium]
MTKNLLHLFRRSAILFLTLTLLLLIAAYLIPSALRQRERAEAELRVAVQLHALALDRDILGYTDRVRALASRTEIRRALQEHLDGRTSREELLSYTAPRFADGVSVYQDLLAAARYDVHGSLVAAWGGPLAPPAPDVHLESTVVDACDRGDGCIELRVTVPIVEDGRVLGHDVALFRMDGALTAPVAGLTLGLESPAPEPGWRATSEPMPNSGLTLHARYPLRLVRGSPGRMDRITVIYVMLMVLLTLAIGYGTLYRGARRLIDALLKQEQRLVELSSRNELLVRETNHRVKNNLAMVIGMIDLQMEGRDEPRSTAVLTDLRERIRSVSEIHDFLYRGSDLHGVPLVDYLDKLVQQTVNTLARRPVHATISGSATTLPPDTALTVGFLVSELCTNALKYGLAGGGELAVTVTEEQGMIAVAVSDNGPTINPAIDPLNADGFGLRMVRVFVDQL